GPIRVRRRDRVGHATARPLARPGRTGPNGPGSGPAAARRSPVARSEARVACGPPPAQPPGSLVHRAHHIARALPTVTPSDRFLHVRRPRVSPSTDPPEP